LSSFSNDENYFKNKLVLQINSQLKGHHILDFTAGQQDFDRIYTAHYEALFKYAFTLISDTAMAEEMVHQVFLKLLERKEPLVLRSPVKSYLYRAVHNECLNYIKHEKVKQVHVEKSGVEISYSADMPSDSIQYKELKTQLQHAVNELPEQCRTIFQMSRFEELKYAEIALALGITIKTVENQIGKALKRLRVQLAEYLPFLLWFLLNL
jgi:RNA polymerase sigma-70 factor (ECF subfamily)